MKNKYPSISKLTVNPSLPLTDQVADYYRSLIINGELRFGDELPPANRFESISHVTVLNAYRKLADEGYINLQRAKRTRVAINFESQHYIILTHFTKEHVIYEDVLLSKCQKLAFYKGRKPDVFYLGHGDIRTLSEAEAAIPGYLNTAINNGHVRAALIHQSDHIPGVIEWLEMKKIHYVSLHQHKDRPCVYFDINKIYEDAIRMLAKKSCRKIMIFPWHGNNPPLKIRGLFREFPGLEWGKKEFSRKSSNPIDIGRNLISTCCKSPENMPDAIIIADDIVGLGALVELKTRGIKVPRDMRLLITGYESQLLPIYRGCDLIITPLEDFVNNAVSLIENIFDKKESAKISKAIPYRILSAEETAHPGKYF